jgi:hypothetical protein
MEQKACEEKLSPVQGRLAEIIKLQSELNNYLNDLESCISRVGALDPQKESREGPEGNDSSTILGLLGGVHDRQLGLVERMRYLLNCLNKLV